ncbi:MAG: hypothetical protein ACXW4H_07615, partial [Candidatus Limnocylindrales bacterium]
AEELVEFYDPTDVFGDLADALAEAFPAVAPNFERPSGDAKPTDAGADAEPTDAGATDEPPAEASSAEDEPSA